MLLLIETTALIVVGCHPADDDGDSGLHALLVQFSIVCRVAERGAVCGVGWVGRSLWVCG